MRYDPFRDPLGSYVEGVSELSTWGMKDRQSVHPLTPVLLGQELSVGRELYHIRWVVHVRRLSGITQLRQQQSPGGKQGAHSAAEARCCLFTECCGGQSKSSAEGTGGESEELPNALDKCPNKATCKILWKMQWERGEPWALRHEWKCWGLTYYNCFIHLLPFLNIGLILFITFCPKSLTNFFKTEEEKEKNNYFFCRKKIFNVNKKYLRATNTKNIVLWIVTYTLLAWVQVGGGEKHEKAPE